MFNSAIYDLIVDVYKRQDLSNGSEINVIVNIITAEQSYELVNINRYVQTGGISYSEYPIYRYGDI